MHTDRFLALLRRRLLSLALAGTAAAAAAGPQTTLPQDPRDLTVLGEQLLFGGWRADSGQAVWALSLRDGSLQRLAPRQAPLETGFRGGFPSALTAYAGAVYFALDDGVHGLELWKTDGSAAATRMVSDLLPGPDGATPGALTVHAQRLYFVARSMGREGARGWRLFSLDARAGSGLPAPVPGAEDLANPRQLTRIGSRLFFTATRTDVGHELWVLDTAADGQPQAPRLLRDIRPGREDGAPAQLTAVGDTLFFSASDGESGHELWASDGTPAGTRRVLDIAPGSASSRPAQLTAVDTAAGPRLFFSADDGVHGAELWTSDGSAAGTRMAAEIRPGRAGAAISSMVAAAGQVLFAATDGTHGVELWRSDGSAAGTVMVADLSPGPGSAMPTDLAVVGEQLLFSAATDDGLPRAWRLSLADATPVARPLSAPGTTGTTSTTSAAPLLQPSRFRAIGQGRIAFAARTAPAGIETLWLMDGAGRVQAAIDNPGSQTPLAAQVPHGPDAPTGVVAANTTNRRTP